MQPAFSILCFTTLAGLGQGLLVAIALAVLAQVEMPPGFAASSVALAGALLVAGLASSFLHLGRKARAWRAVLMWRTSWMSREVIVLPAFVALAAGWWAALSVQPAGASRGWPWLPLLVIAGALALWYCTAMIYACIRFVEEWAHPLTALNFVAVGLASGLVLACALGAWQGAAAFVRQAGPCALAVTLLAWALRSTALRRNAGLRHRSTLQSATGIQAPRLAQHSMGMTAGSFNTREFFHGRTAALLRNVRLGSQLGAFALPALLLAWGLTGDAAWPWLLAAAVQAPGVLADRWLFFAQAKHPQNLYYQVVS